MKICQNCNQVYTDAAETCSVCGRKLLDTDAARVNAATLMGKYEKSESKFGKFMKAAAKMTMKMADVIDKKNK